MNGKTNVGFFFLPHFLPFLLFCACLEGADINLSIESASRFKEPLRELPASAEILLDRQLSALSQKNLDKKLSLLVPGLDSSRSFSDFSDRNAVLTMRGFGIGTQGGRGQGRTLLMINGLPLNSSANGSLILNDLDKEDIEKVEIIKGPSSALYGSNALAGVINIFTRKPQDKKEISASVGSYGLFDSRARAGFSFGDFYLGFSGGYLESGGYIKALPEDRSAYSVKSWLREKNASLKAYWGAPDYGNFSAYLSRLDGINGLGTNYRGDARGEYRRNVSDTGMISWHLEKNGAEFKISAYWTESSQDRHEASSPAKFTDITVDKGDKGLMSAAYAGFFDCRFSLGFDWKRGYVDGYDDYLNGKYASDRAKIETYSPFIQAEKKIFSDKLNLTAGLRYDYSKFYDGYVFNSSAPGFFPGPLSKRAMDKASLKASAGFDYAPGFSQYISYSQGFRNPELESMVLALVKGSGSNKWYQKPNPSLGPEKSQTVESGFKINPAAGFYTDPSFYITWADDFIYQILTGVNDPSYGKEKIYANIAKVRIYGAELPLKYINRNFVFSVSYAQSYSRIIEAPGLAIEGKRLTYAPRTIYSLSVQKIFKRGSVFADWAYKSRQFADDANSVSVPGYGCAGAGAELYAGRDYQLSFSVSNIFDRRFQQSESELAPGRTFVFSVKKNF